MTFVDLHTHGAAGYSYDDATEAQLAQALTVHRSHGTTSTLLSLISAPVDRMTERLRELHSLLASAPEIGGVRVHGIHLEGPFLASSRAGAHDPGALCLPTPEVIETLLEAGEGILRQVTLAPELPGAEDAIKRFTKAGVAVAIGHTEADYDAASAAFDLGANLLTHAFNAMPGLGHREPGPLGAAISRDHVSLEVIADGVHVHPVVLRTLFSAAPGRIALVTDSMEATGLGDGSYRLGDLDVDVRDGAPRLAETQTLAGSTLTLDKAVERVVAAGVPHEEALAAVSTTPARALGLDLASNDTVD